MIEITYYHTLYKKEVTDKIPQFGDIVFCGGYAYFASMGRELAVEVQNVRRIATAEED